MPACFEQARQPSGVRGSQLQIVIPEDVRIFNTRHRLEAAKGPIARTTRWQKRAKKAEDEMNKMCRVAITLEKMLNVPKARTER